MRKQILLASQSKKIRVRLWRTLSIGATITLLFCSLLPGKAEANAGDLDLTFGAGGKVITDLSPGLDFALAVAVQPDGRIVTAGFATNIFTSRDFALARYDANGNLDMSFGVGGKVVSAFTSDFDQAIALILQPDGKIVCAGEVFSNETNFDFILARYNSNGSLDSTFGTEGRVVTDFGANQDIAFGLALQPDGGLIVVGSTQNLATFDSDFALARYTSNGSLDSTFGVGGRVTTDFFGDLDMARAVAVQPDGRVVAAGQGSLKGFANFGLARYNSDGSLDTSFGNGGTVTSDFVGSQDIATSVVIRGNGNILAGGEKQDIRSIVSTFALASFNSDGSLDSTFGIGGKVTTSIGSSSASIASLAIQSDGKIVAAGTALNSPAEGSFALARYQDCGYSIFPGSVFLSSSGEEGSLNVIAPAGCKWAAVSNSSWLTLTSDSNGSGNGEVSYVVRDNHTGSGRQGALAVAGHTFTVTQDGGLGEDCQYILSPTFKTFTASGGAGIILVTAEPRCAWSGVTNVNWIHVTSNCCGIGSGSVSYTVLPNPTTVSRKAMITIAGKVFAIKQKGS
jgi:uncharacterized delta-60 repeat protein